MTGPDPRLRTPAAILATAAHVLAERGHATVADIAAATGVGRATFYRYFPSREALVAALAREALDELSGRIEDARLGRAPVEEAIERLLRICLAVGDRYIVLIRERVQVDSADVERRLGDPIRAVFERGIAEGILRADVGVEPLLHLFGSLVVGGLESGLHESLGPDETARTLASVFLDGTRSHG